MRYALSSTSLMHTFNTRTLSLSMLSPLYMAEISPPEVRGSLMALEQFAIVLGAVLGFWTGFFTRDCTCVYSVHRLVRYRRS